MSEVVTRRVADAVAPRRRFRRAPASGRRSAAIAGQGAKKNYRKGPVEVPVLRGVSLAVRQGEFLAVVGQSGCGKTTLLHLLGTLDVPDRRRDPLRRPADRQPLLGRSATGCATAASA